MAAENCIECDVAIVGSGFAGALIAHELGKRHKKVIVLEAGAGVPPNINQYMRRFTRPLPRSRKIHIRLISSDQTVCAIPARSMPVGRLFLH